MGQRFEIVAHGGSTVACRYLALCPFCCAARRIARVALIGWTPNQLDPCPTTMYLLRPSRDNRYLKRCSGPSRDRKEAGIRSLTVAAPQRRCSGRGILHGPWRLPSAFGGRVHRGVRLADGV